MGDDDQPPALEDAEMDDASSGASFVTDSSGSVSIGTSSSDEGSDGDDGLLGGAGFDDDDDDRNLDESGLGKAFLVPLKTGSDGGGGGGGEQHEEEEEGHYKEEVRLAALSPRSAAVERDEALERNAMRRQASNEMLQAMRAAVTKGKDVGKMAAAGEVGGEGGFRRRPPPRTKSGDGPVGSVNGGGGPPLRRPPHRTKSGDNFGGGAAPRESPALRKPPARTKSGNGFARSVPQGCLSQSVSSASDAEDFAVQLRGGDGGRDRNERLERNAMRRQASSDMLLAMRQSIQRTASTRAKSSTAAMKRRAPARTKSGSAVPVEEFSNHH